MLKLWEKFIKQNHPITRSHPTLSSAMKYGYSVDHSLGFFITLKGLKNFITHSKMNEQAAKSESDGDDEILFLYEQFQTLVSILNQNDYEVRNREKFGDIPSRLISYVTKFSSKTVPLPYHLLKLGMALTLNITTYDDFSFRIVRTGRSESVINYRDQRQFDDFINDRLIDIDEYVVVMKANNGDNDSEREQWTDSDQSCHHSIRLQPHHYQKLYEYFESCRMYHRSSLAILFEQNNAWIRLLLLTYKHYGAYDVILSLIDESITRTLASQSIGEKNFFKVDPSNFGLIVSMTNHSNERQLSNKLKSYFDTSQRLYYNHVKGFNHAIDSLLKYSFKMNDYDFIRDIITYEYQRKGHLSNLEAQYFLNIALKTYNERDLKRFWNEVFMNQSATIHDSGFTTRRVSIFNLLYTHIVADDMKGLLQWCRYMNRKEYSIPSEMAEDLILAYGNHPPSLISVDIEDYNVSNSEFESSDSIQAYQNDSNANGDQNSSRYDNITERSISEYFTDFLYHVSDMSLSFVVKDINMDSVNEERALSVPMRTLLKTANSLINNNHVDEAMIVLQSVHPEKWPYESLFLKMIDTISQSLRSDNETFPVKLVDDMIIALELWYDELVNRDYMLLSANISMPTYALMLQSSTFRSIESKTARKLLQIIESKVIVSYIQSLQFSEDKLKQWNIITAKLNDVGTTTSIQNSSVNKPTASPSLLDSLMISNYSQRMSSSLDDILRANELSNKIIESILIRPPSTLEYNRTLSRHALEALQVNNISITNTTVAKQKKVWIDPESPEKIQEFRNDVIRLGERSWKKRIRDKIKSSPPILIELVEQLSHELQRRDILWSNPTNSSQDDLDDNTLRLEAIVENLVSQSSSLSVEEYDNEMNLKNMPGSSFRLFGGTVAGSGHFANKKRGIRAVGNKKVWKAVFRNVLQTGIP
jgi:hypothetical protein